MYTKIYLLITTIYNCIHSDFQKEYMVWVCCQDFPFNLQWQTHNPYILDIRQCTSWNLWTAVPLISVPSPWQILQEKHWCWLSGSNPSFNGFLLSMSTGHIYPRDMSKSQNNTMHVHLTVSTCKPDFVSSSWRGCQHYIFQCLPNSQHIVVQTLRKILGVLHHITTNLVQAVRVCHFCCFG